MSYSSNMSRTHEPPGFTLMEVLVALCIVLIALVPLIHLHVASIRMIDSGSHMARATLVAGDRLAEILARDVPELGKSSGHVKDETRDVVYRWTSVVTDAPVPALESARLMGLRQVHVDVAWQDGEREAAVSFDTLVCLPSRSAREILGNANVDKSNDNTTLPRTRL